MTDDSVRERAGSATTVNPWNRISCAMVLPACLLALGCSSTHYTESADREVYRIIDETSEDIGGMPTEFSIEEQPTSGTEPIILPAEVISLREAIEIAVKNSRRYQSEKESLYSQGLALSSARHEFAPRLFAVGSGELSEGDGDDTVSSTLSAGLTKMLATGADLSLSITTSLFRVISGGDPEEVAASTINARMVQPLLSGAGRKVALENLTQSERDMVYGIREFVRFRKDFSVGIAKSYFSLLEQMDRVENAWMNYTNLVDDATRAALMAEAGRLPRFQLDQTRQDALRAKDRWVRERQGYENALDEFKIDLGLPTETAIEPATAELDSLLRFVSVPLDVTGDEAIVIALENRLDLKNDAGAVEDAERKVVVAQDRLRTNLDLILGYEIQTDGETKPVNFSGGDERLTVGVDADLPLDRKLQRNDYRQSIITLAATRRNLTEGIDRVKLEVRDAFRGLEQARRSYEIQQESVTLAEQRVDSTTLLQQAGRATTRDVLESREALLEARNLVTAALVDYFNARLDLLLAMERLRIDDTGFWMVQNENRTDAEQEQE